MSIFKSTFTKAVKEQLTRRQEIMTSRTTSGLQYLNSRNAWIRLSSSVNVGPNGGTNDLARKYVLQGGTLNDAERAGTAFTGSLKSGLGSSFSNAYSNTAQNGTKYRLGIRPMPGITSAEIKSLSAYGSLREVTINFQCWDIKQLEDLEVLYMRPGYTALVEWGWAPFIGNDGKYNPTFTDYYDIIEKKPTDRTVLFRELFEKSTKYGGNYDAMFGYVKNYQWSARMDGGYDCQTTIISTGEIIESLKVNYLLPIKVENTAAQRITNFVQTGDPDIKVPLAPPKDNKAFGLGFVPTITNLAKNNSNGVLRQEFIQGDDGAGWKDGYDVNILAGVWKEAYYKIANKYTLSPDSIFNKKGVVISPLKLTTSTNTTDTNTIVQNDTLVYITLEAAMDVLNNYIVAKSSLDNQPLVRLSLYPSDYDGTPSSPLLCAAHPLQVSVDPSVCLIKSPLWAGGEIVNTAVTNVAEDPNLIAARRAFDSLSTGFVGFGTNKTALLEGFQQITNKDIYNAVETIFKNLPPSSTIEYSSIQEMLNKELGFDDRETAVAIRNQLNSIGVQLKFTTKAIPNPISPTSVLGYTVSDFVVTPSFPVNSNAASATVIAAQGKQALSNVSFLKNLPKDFFFQNEYSELGIIGNIYVNLDFLYKQALDPSLEAADTKEKNEISLYNYLKNVMSAIQSAIGNINNFEIHVDPVDNNVARIIDVNYTEANKKDTYKNLFELQVHNLQSVVRSYTLQSQIFPNQSAVVAIGSQVKGGQLGMQTNTMIDFNRNLTDRIIPEKVDGVNTVLEVKDNKTNISNGLAQIIQLFSSFNQSPVDSTESTTDYSTLASKAKNSLRDLIIYFQSITRSPGSNRNLIPTKFSFEMDGIGGLVIGHMFKLPKEVLPKGYRGEGVGSELGNAITSISHTISKGDWVTKVDSLNIVLDDPQSSTAFSSLNLEDIKEIIAESILGGAAGTGGKAQINANTTDNFGKVDPSVPKWGAAVLDMLAYTEGTARAGKNGYDIGVGYTVIPGWTENYTNDHPRIATSIKGVGKSTAAGRYQFLSSTWDELVRRNIGSPSVTKYAFNKKNQDVLGYALAKQRIKGGDPTAKAAYDIALQGVKDVTQNQPFLTMLGLGKAGLAGGWASIPDKTGRYQYSNQGHTGVGTQDVYNIYLEAVKKYN